MTYRYTAIKSNISTKYVEIEEQLVDEFIEAHRSLDMKRMKQYAKVLQPFFGVRTFVSSSSTEGGRVYCFSFSLQGSAKVVENYIHGSVPVSR